MEHTTLATPERGLRQARDYWDRRALRSATDCDRVEQSRRTQRMRFEVFVRQHALQGKSILDVGCGTGDFLEHLHQKGITCDYVGFDVSPAMVRRCRERFPEAQFVSGNLLSWQPAQPFDYTVSIGIHNIKIEGGWELLKQITHRQFELCRIAAHVSILTDRYPGFAPHIQAWRAEEVLTLALSITPYVAVHHHYLPNDFSVTLYRQPLIDTCPDLLLG